MRNWGQKQNCCVYNFVQGSLVSQKLSMPPPLMAQIGSNLPGWNVPCAR